MARFSLAFAGVSALAIALPAAAQAQGMAPVHGTISGQYSNLDSGFGDADARNGDLGVVYNGGVGLGGQANLGFGSMDFGDFGGDDADIWGIGGALTYGFDGGKVGAGVNYQSSDLYGPDFSITNYGVSGEAYIEEILTVGGRVGGFRGDFSYDGFYIGGSASVYPMANLALQGEVEYADPDTGGDMTSFGIGAEFLPVTGVPVTIGGGYRNVDAGWPFNEVDVWRIQLKAYLGTPGNGTLIQNHRNGALELGSVLGVIAGN